MNAWQTALLIGAVVTMFLSSNVNRAALWIFMGGASFIASTAYARIGLPYPPFFTMMCDVMVCLSIYFLATRRWEIWLFRAFQVSVLVSLLYLVGFIGPHYWYIVALEAINWVALLLISGTAMLQWIGADNEVDTRGYWSRRVHGAYSAFFAARQDHPFHRS